MIKIRLPFIRQTMRLKGGAGSLFWIELNSGIFDKKANHHYN
jgi:hypothetical protein